MDDDLSRSDQLHILGNGVVPQQAALAFRELWAALFDGVANGEPTSQH